MTAEDGRAAERMNANEQKFQQTIVTNWDKQTERQCKTGQANIAGTFDAQAQDARSVFGMM